MDLLITNARVVTCDGANEGTAADRLQVLDGALVGVDEGKISYVGPSSGVDATAARRILDGAGGVLLPGLVDAHTHLVFGGSRVDEFARRMAGEDYRAIAAAGGGIAATVRWTREAGDEALFDLAARRARAMRAHGVTTIEVKSGYGLSPEQELRCLRIARRLGSEGIARVSGTYLGAHAVPPERRAERARYVDEVIDTLPRVAEEGLAEACDAYVDEGAFTLDEGRRILEAAAAVGLRVKAHVGQFADLGGAEMLASLSALSADHLEAVGDEGARAMAEAGVVAVLLPGAWRTLRQRPPDVERLRRHGVAMAVATDCNPGTSPTTDLPLCVSLAVRDAGMTAEEALLGVTCEAARALGRQDVAGRIRVGAPADLALYASAAPTVLAYALGGLRARFTLLGGEIVHEEPAELLPVW